MAQFRENKILSDNKKKDKYFFGDFLLKPALIWLAIVTIWYTRTSVFTRFDSNHFLREIVCLFLTMVFIRIADNFRDFFI